MRVVFVNGPVQNGDFTLASAPGKAVCLRLADALNQLCGNEAMPHLWNIVTAHGDRRHRSDPSAPRPMLEASLLSAKYDSGFPAPQAGVMTDAGPEMDRFALPLLEELLAAGVLRVQAMRAPHCQACGNMTGVGSRPCAKCGGNVSQDIRRKLLVFPTAGGPQALALNDIHARDTRHAAHLRGVAGNVPDPLIMSRTRDYGVSLAPLGLDGLVLDPRAGLHMAALRAGAALGPDIVVMLTTGNALINVAAYGAPFRSYRDTRLRYGVHGRIPVDRLQQLQAIPQAAPASDSGLSFGSWFLPLCALKDKVGIAEGQLVALHRFFQRALRARPATTAPEQAAQIRDAIKAGDMAWVRNGSQLPYAITMACPRDNDGEDS